MILMWMLLCSCLVGGLVSVVLSLVVRVLVLCCSCVLFFFILFLLVKLINVLVWVVSCSSVVC